MEMQEDNIFHQTKLHNPNAKIRLYGDDLWAKNFYHSFDSIEFQLPTCRLFQEIDEDKKLMSKWIADVEAGVDAQLTIIHMIGLDGYAHFSNDPNSEDVQRGVTHVDEMVRKVVESMDE